MMVDIPKTRIDGTVINTSLIEYLSATDGLDGKYSQKTMADYSRKVISLEKEIEKSGKSVTPDAMVKLLRRKIEDGAYMQATVRAMKAALIFWLLGKAQARLDSGKDLSELQEALDQVKSLQAKSSRKGTKTSSRKLKMFNDDVVESIVEYANKPGSPESLGTLIAFIKANLLVGLRPSEWFGASLFSYLERDKSGRYAVNADSNIKSTPSLIVQNGKASYGRANGYYRELLLSSISDDELASIVHFKTIIEEFTNLNPQITSNSELADAFFIPLQQMLAYTLRKLNVPNSQMPSSYSTRHQAVANAKFSGMSALEIAAFFGHSSLETAKTHYGKKTNGSRKMTFIASRESVAAVPTKKHGPGLDPTVIAALTAADWNAKTGNTP